MGRLSLLWPVLYFPQIYKIFLQINFFNHTRFQDKTNHLFYSITLAQMDQLLSQLPLVAGFATRDIVKSWKKLLEITIPTFGHPSRGE
jgi:hypothetical protein